VVFDLLAGVLGREHLSAGYYQRIRFFQDKLNIVVFANDCLIHKHGSVSMASSDQDTQSTKW
jgi:hypothetical protein